MYGVFGGLSAQRRAIVCSVPTVCGSVLNALQFSWENSFTAMEDGRCDLEGGLVISQRLMSSMCPRLWECGGGGGAAPGGRRGDAPRGLDLTRCVYLISGKTCTSSKQVKTMWGCLFLTDHLTDN